MSTIVFTITHVHTHAFFLRPCLCMCAWALSGNVCDCARRSSSLFPAQNELAEVIARAVCDVETNVLNMWAGRYHGNGHCHVPWENQARAKILVYLYINETPETRSSGGKLAPPPRLAPQK